MSYSISLNIDLKKFNISYYEDIIKKYAFETNNINLYYDYELEGINNYIKKNNKIIIIEYNILNNLITFLEYIINIHQIHIEYIYHNNNIIYYSKKYINSLDKNLCDKNKLYNTMLSYINNTTYKKLYNILKIYNLSPISSPSSSPSSLSPSSSYTSNFLNIKPLYI